MRTSKSFIVLTAVAVLASLVATTQADYIPNAITGVTATGANSADVGNSSLPNAYNDGAGNTYDIRANPALSAVSGYGLTVAAGVGTHGNSWTQDWQSNTGGSGPYTSETVWFIADLQAAYSTLDELYIWNVNENNQINRGTKDLDIYYATALPMTFDNDFSDAAWTKLTGLTALPKGTGSAGMPVSAVVDLGSVPSARYFGFDILDDYADDVRRAGLSELQFTVPEPGTLTVLALGAVGLLKRRGKK